MARHRALCAALLALTLAAASAAAAPGSNNKKQANSGWQKAASISCSAAQPCPNPNWSCCAGKCLNPARGLACVQKQPCPAAAVCGGAPGGGWGGGGTLSCCTADAGVCVAGGTRCCPRDRVCGDSCCASGESCATGANGGAAQCRSALPRPLQPGGGKGGGGGGQNNGKRVAVASAREAGVAAGPLVFGSSSSDGGGGTEEDDNAAAERRWRSAGYEEDPCGRATAVLTATRLVGGALAGGRGGDLAGSEGRATATVRACCELCATTPGCGHFSFDADGGKCWLKAAATAAVAKRLASAAAVVATSDDGGDGGGAPTLSFSADPSYSSSVSAALQGLWAVPSRAFVSGTLAYAPSPELCAQNRLCQGSGAASCCPAPVGGGGGGGWTCSASGACCPPDSGPPCGSGCGCGPGYQCSPGGGGCVAAASGAKQQQQQQQQQQPKTAAAALLNQQAVLKQQPAGSVVNYAAAPSASLVLVQDPSDPQGCHARAGAGAAAGAFAFRANTMIAPRSGGALNRDRPTLAATAAACCLQCAGIANCAHFSWDGAAMACSLYSDRAGADGAAAALRLEVPRQGSVAGDMVPQAGLKSLMGDGEGGGGQLAAAAAEAENAGARCPPAGVCGGEGLCCRDGEACLKPTGLPGAGGAEHTCCPSASVCGGRCGCDDGSTCVGGNTCCPAERACGGTACCGAGSRCSSDGRCVRDTGIGGGSNFQLVTGQGAGSIYNRGFNSNWGVSQYSAVPLSVGGGNR